MNPYVAQRKRQQVTGSANAKWRELSNVDLQQTEGERDEAKKQFDECSNTV